MRKKYTALIAIHLVALAFMVYLYVVMAIPETIELSPSTSPTELPSTSTPPTQTPNAPKDPAITVSFIHWDPHNLTFPNQISILSPHNGDTLQTGYIYMMVGVSSSNWLINGVFYTADWISGPQPIWFYNLRSAETALFATVAIPNVPAGNHTLSVHANLHDGTFLTRSVSFSIEPTKSGDIK